MTDLQSEELAASTTASQSICGHTLPDPLANAGEDGGDGNGGGGGTEFLYDADGNRLITRTAEKSTLHLGDHTEVVLNQGSTTPEATRYVPFGNGHQGVLSDDGVWSITLADHHGTGQLAIDAATLKLTQRRTLPFGDPRGTPAESWPSTKGFVGGTDDTATTGLTHLGARHYDPTTGRFISVDPIMDLADPQQTHGYTYANNNPLTWSDPVVCAWRTRVALDTPSVVLEVTAVAKNTLQKPRIHDPPGLRWISGAASSARLQRYISTT